MRTAHGQAGRNGQSWVGSGEEDWHSAASPSVLSRHAPSRQKSAHSPHQGKYTKVSELRAELDLIWSNAVIFNTEESAVGKQATAMQHFTTKKFAQVRPHAEVVGEVAR